MKITVLIALILTASTIFANNKTNSRKPANAEEAQCQAEAGATAQGAVKGLGQDVTIESVKVDFIKDKYETYKVRLRGGGATAETTETILVKLTAEDGRCGLRSIEMPTAIF